MKPRILALVGPTGSGKTQTAIRICQALDAEVVSMDSMQIYRGMDIGTAKPTPPERAAAPHHMIDVAEPEELFTVSMYREMAMRAIDDILARGRLPLLVGGTGLYLQAISYELSLGERGADSAMRLELRQIAQEPDGPWRLHERLKAVDPQSAQKLHPNDVRRVIRALEIYESSGKAKSEQADEARQEGPYHVLVYGLTMPREQMYARINARVNAMVASGLVEEVQRLLARGIEPRQEGGAMQAIGYKEIVAALRGEMPLDKAIDLIKQGTRRYAKRQWTWFRRDPRTVWFDWSAYPTGDALTQALIERMRSDLSVAESTRPTV